MPVSPATVVNNPDPATEAVAVPGSTPFAKPCRGLYIGGAGSITVTMPNTDSITFAGLLAGTILPVRCTAVTAQSASMNIIALF